MSIHDPSHVLGPFARFALAVLVSEDRRAEFEGDLLEERALRVSEGKSTRVWLWSQIARSAPALLVQQIRGDGEDKRIAWQIMALTLVVGAVVFGVEGLYTRGPLLAGLTLVGLALACTGLFFRTAAMRLVPLALGVAIGLIGDVFTPGVSGENAFVIFCIPVFAYASIDEARAKREKPTT